MLYESILPIIKSPRSFIYEELGMAYYKTTDGTDFKDAIDYLTLAMDISKSEDGYGFNHSEMLEKLKIRSGYNGIKIDPNSSGGIQRKEDCVQYIKRFNNK